MARLMIDAWRNYSGHAYKTGFVDNSGGIHTARWGHAANPHYAASQQRQAKYLAQRLKREGVDVAKILQAAL